MNMTTEIHPDVVLESLLAKGARAQRRRNLAQMHELCRVQYDVGSRDFSLPSIGRLCEAQGLLKGRALYNAQSADYRALIEAWATYAGPPAPKASKPLASYEYLMRIEDPAIRSIMQAIISERDKLKAQLNVLKTQTQLTVDRRPLGATIVPTPSTYSAAVATMSEHLTPSERNALQNAISHEFLEDQGWQEGSHGEITNAKGRTLFDVGFARAIRKILGRN